MADTYSSLYDSPAVKMHNPGSEPPTRASTPSLAPHSRNFEIVGINGDVKEITAEMSQETSPGVLPEDVYDTALSWWRARIRRLLVRNLKRESAWLGAMQASCILIALSYGCLKVKQTHVRTDWLDAYFVYTSSLGTHTFFMTLLPAVFFFGHDKVARGSGFK